MKLTKYRYTFYSEYVRNIAGKFECESFCLFFLNGPQNLFVYFYPVLGPYCAEKRNLSLWEEFLELLQELKEKGGERR